MDQSRRSLLINALKDKKVNQPCQRCGNNKFSVVGETNLPLQDDPNVLTIGGPSVPTVIVACDNCGYIMQHATIALGLTRESK